MKDKIVKCLAYNGRISIICANTTNLVEEARRVHDLSPVVTAAFGRMLTITSIMGLSMKNKTDKLTIQIKGNGEIGKMLVVADNMPNVKGYVENPYVDLPLNEFGKLDVGGAVGNSGYINVIKDIGLKEPYIGMSDLVSGEIGDDFANYFVNSEQTKSAVGVGVLVNSKGVKQAGGYIITAMPDATQEDIFNLEQAIFKAGAISKMLDENLSLIEIVRKVTGDKNAKVLKEDINPKYECDCSKEKFETSLATIGKKDLEEILAIDKKAEVVCHFCNSKYGYNEKDLEEILKNIDNT